MKIMIRDEMKQLLAKVGPNKLFGDDVDHRKKLSPADAMSLFDRVWKATLEKQVSSADRCAADDAKSRLTPAQQQYFDSSQEHRSFRMQSLNLEFIVQLLCLNDDELQMTQLWRVSSSDSHPKTLFVTFPTVELRQRFRTLATNLRAKDEDLGLKLLMEFMEKHPSQFWTDHV